MRIGTVLVKFSTYFSVPHRQALETILTGLRSSMKSSKKTGNSGKSAGNLKIIEGTEDADPPQWAKDLISRVQNIERNLDRMWKKCDEIIDHVNAMDERRFETGRKLWNTIAETSAKTNEMDLTNIRGDF